MEVRVFRCFFVIVLCFLHGRGDSKHNSINKKELHPSDYNANGNGVTSVGGLFPNVFNLAARAHITANATCGEAGPEVYCKLVEHVQMRAPQCGVCDAHSPDPAKRHPIERAIDGTTSWWQSPSLQNGHQYEWVTITLDLKQVYQVAYVIVKSAISPRPANWILERSVDGSIYLPWQYYAQSDEECWARYGLPPTRGKPSYKSDSDIICTSYFSKLNPLEGGEIHTSLVNGRPGANESRSSLLQFTLARFVRLRLQKIRTLNAEFMSLARDDDASVTRRLFYSIKDISIGGQCVCSGHAAKCTHSDKHGHPQCECQHNTCGDSCEQCCPLFNQFPWKAGTPQDRAQCEPCECHNHADSCRYDADVADGKLSVDIHGRYEGGGVCINCTAHTEGVNCERCEEGWFRPRDVSPRDIEPCRPCNCPTVTSTGYCNSNLNSELNTDRVCECKPGYSGPNCDNCALGFRHFPRCEPCPCDARGMELMGCEQSCVCKPHVEGQRCDQCKPGYFSLDLDNPEGCTACYCSGVTKVCHEASLHLQNMETMSGWLVSDLPVSITVVPMVDQETHHLTVRNYEMSGVESYYWLAPEAYQGNHLTSYGSNITFSVSWIVMRGDTSGKPTTGPDIIVVGSNNMRLGHGESSYNQVRNTTITVTLREGDWYHVPDSVKDIVTRLKRKDYRGDKATRAQMMSVLADVRHVLLRAKFHTDQAEGSLQSVSLQTGTYNGSGSLTRHVEHCTCPPGYSGLSCESCKYGYTRVNSSSDHQGEAECRKCDCHGHAPTCDPLTGQCAACEHNTTGSKCGKCSAGFYGDARQGTPSDCHPCACPSFNPEGNYSPTCEQGGHDYICTACPAGYAGDHCERCAGGYFGDPLIQGSTCQSCDCGGGPCNGLTGQCLQCQGNTEGWKCERCIKGHYGDPQQGDCRACRCDPLGSVNSDSCDVESGQCLCRERFRGRTCDRCEVGYGNKTAGCLSCSCHPKGSVSSVCDSVTGECTCKPGVTGPHCDTCQDLHFNLSSTGCQGCGCHQYGSRNSMCDIVSGQCPCKLHVIGRACDYCQDGFWGLSNQGCQQCHCDPVGSNNGSCNPRTGQCPCKKGVGGQRCDICLPGHYGLTASGCSKCDVCVKTGHICDPDTGRCVCPPHTLGPTCSLCQPNSWGFEPGKGCKPCECNGPGAIHPQCDLVTGRCSCRNGFHGDHCVSCTAGHFGFPRCQQCSCNLPGTLPDNCDTSTGQCSCDDKGQCPCKVNVEGKRCDRCKLGTFGLQADNIDGCTQCFCFGRTTACTQAGLIWSQILAGPSRTLYLEYKRDKPRYKPGHKDVAYIQLLVPGSGEQNFKGDNARLNSTNNLLLVPGTAGDVRIGANHLLDKPLYWQLPSQFLGDKILSYGGYLQFTLENEDGANPAPKHVLSSQPLIQIQGNSRIILEHYPILPNPLGRYKVRFHESLWRLKTDKKGKVSREVFMLALQNIQHIFIRTSEYLDYTKVV